MKKILFLLSLLIIPFFFFSCDDEDTNSNIYGVWIPKEEGQKGNIWLMNNDNTGALYYINEILEDGTYVCDECLTEKIIKFSIKDKTLNLDFATYSVSYPYDYLNEKEFKMTNRPILKKESSPKIKEEKRSCE